MKNIKIITSLLVVLAFFSTCKKMVDVGQPKNQLTSAEVFADSSDASETITGIYVSMMNSSLGLCSGGMTVYTGLSSDEIYQTATNTTFNQFYIDNVVPTNNTNAFLWSAGYKYVYAVNACVSGVTSSNSISATAKTQILAEARFVRGFVYFYLENLYGGVPLVLSTDYTTTSKLARSGTDAVYAQMVADLLFAEANLGNNTGSNDRPSTLVASAMLAKVYLYMGKYDLAQAEASKVINSGIFTLEPDLSNVFLSSSGETIWQLDLPNNKYTWEGQNFVPTSTLVKPRYILTPSLAGSFENGDQRLTKWVKVNSLVGVNYPYPYKYKNNTFATVATENYVMLRLGEQYLIRAEAETQQNDVVDAVNDLNTIRNRAGLLNTTASDQATLLSAIVTERRHELFCEWGNRWLDLKRLNLATTVLSPLKPTWNVNDELYPVPQVEINTNSFLMQNPGY
jgi:hypothetical protein